MNTVLEMNPIGNVRIMGVKVLWKVKSKKVVFFGGGGGLNGN